MDRRRKKLEASPLIFPRQNPSTKSIPACGTFNWPETQSIYAYSGPSHRYRQIPVSRFEQEFLTSHVTRLVSNKKQRIVIGTDL